MIGEPSNRNDSAGTSIAPEAASATSPPPARSSADPAGVTARPQARAEEALTGQPGVLPREPDGLGTGLPDAGLPDAGQPDAGLTARDRLRQALPDRDRLRAYWRSPQGLVMLATTGLALALRLFLLSRPGFLTGVTEYDDGVYLGGSIRLLSGAVPYHDFAFVQPPGILLLMAPVALIAKISTTTHAMAAARLLTVAASAGCVPLAGALVRYRGVGVTLVTCGLLAIYPDDISTAHTLILEPWMNLLLLAGTVAAFRRGHLAGPDRLLAAGLAIGLAASVKYWAGLPALVLFACCLLARSPARKARVKRYLLGLAAGFVIPVFPFAVSGPGLFFRSTVLDQASRAGTWVPVSLRLAHLTGLVDFLSAKGTLTLAAGTHSLFASGSTAAVATMVVGWVPVILTVVLVGEIGLGYLARPARPAPLAWYALVNCAGAAAAVLSYSAFFYHYADFVAPWLALSAGCAAGTLGTALAARPRVRQALIAAVAVAVTGLAVFQARELYGLRAANIYGEQALIPAGACVVTDQISLPIAANRFSAGVRGCPDVLDSLATTLVADDGVSVQAGAKADQRAVTAWRSYFSHARYVWLSGGNARRIPWTPALRAWFSRHFRLLRLPAWAHQVGRVYKRR